MEAGAGRHLSVPPTHPPGGFPSAVVWLGDITCEESCFPLIAGFTCCLEKATCGLPEGTAAGCCGAQELAV